jgi:hypothetical protein
MTSNLERDSDVRSPERWPVARPLPQEYRPAAGKVKTHTECIALRATSAWLSRKFIKPSLKPLAQCPLLFTFNFKPPMLPVPHEGGFEFALGVFGNEPSQQVGPSCFQ